jgi:hypothetical protein
MPAAEARRRLASLRPASEVSTLQPLGEAPADAGAHVPGGDHGDDGRFGHGRLLAEVR